MKNSFYVLRPEGESLLNLLCIKELSKQNFEMEIESIGNCKLHGDETGIKLNLVIWETRGK